MAGTWPNMYFSREKAQVPRKLCGARSDPLTSQWHHKGVSQNSPAMFPRSKGFCTVCILPHRIAESSVLLSCHLLPSPKRVGFPATDRGISVKDNTLYKYEQTEEGKMTKIENSEDAGAQIQESFSVKAKSVEKLNLLKKKYIFKSKELWFP